MPMKKMNNKIKLLILAVIILCVFIIPLIINEAYKLDRGYVTAWDASDTLTFYGNILTFLGTVVLGLSTIILSNRANEINNRLSLLEEERFKTELQPFVLVSNWKLEETKLQRIIQSPQKLYIQIGTIEIDYHEVCLCLSLFFTNTSNSFATVYYSNAKIYQKGVHVNDWKNSTSNQPNPELYLKNGETGEIVFFCTVEEMESFRGGKIEFELILDNRFSEKYKETLDIIIPQIGVDSNGWYISLSPQNYLIKKL